MHPASFLRRITAVLSGALLLQLSLLASGTLCPMHVGMRASAHAATMARATHGMMHGARHDARQAPAAPAGRCDMDGSCDMPWTPAGCASMSACAIGMSAQATPTAAVVARGSTSVDAGDAASLPLGPTFAPELPPPRA